MKVTSEIVPAIRQRLLDRRARQNTAAKRKSVVAEEDVYVSERRLYCMATYASDKLEEIVVSHVLHRDTNSATVGARRCVPTSGQMLTPRSLS